jgi:hypothetical protein
MELIPKPLHGRVGYGSRSGSVPQTTELAHVPLSDSMHVPILQLTLNSSLRLHQTSLLKILLWI